MAKQWTQREIETLRAAMAPDGATAEETARVLAALAPHLSAAALRLRARRAERRTLLRQALALAGCSVLFAALAWIGYRNWEALIAQPVLWRCLAGFALLSIFIIGCLPIFMRKGSCQHE